MTQSEEPPNLTKTVVRGIGLAGSGAVSGEAIRLVFYLVLARLAVPSDFGEYAAGATVVTVGFLLTDSGMLAALVHRRDRVEEAANTALIATIVGGIGLTAAALAISPLIGLFFKSDTVGLVAAALSGLLLLRCVGIVPNALLQRRFSFLRRVVVEPVAVIAFGVVGVIAVGNGMGVWGLVLAHYAYALSEVLLLWVMGRWRPRPRLASFGMWRELIAYGRHVLAAGIVDRVPTQTATILVGRFLGTASLGQYSYGFRLASASYLTVVGAIAWVLFPAFARIADDRPRFKDAYLRAFRGMATAAAPLSLILLPLGLPLAILLLGEEWRDAGYVAMAMCAYPLANGLVSVTLEAVKADADGSPRRMTETHLVVAVATAALMAALLPFGLAGVAVGLSMGTAAGAFYAVRVLRRTLDVSAREVFAQAWAPIGAATLMGLLVLLAEMTIVDAASHGVALGLVMLFAEALCGAAIYLATLRVLRPNAIRELLELTRLGGSREPEAAGSAAD